MSETFGIGVQINSTGVEQLERQGAAADRLGFTFVSVGDNPGLMRDTYLSLGQLAGVTRECSVGTTVTTPHHRDPLVVASAFSSVAELAPGRTFLGIGTGRARTPATIQELREHVVALRELWTRGETDVRGERVRLAWDAPPVPVVVCGSGRRALEVAGELADAVIIETGLSGDMVERARGWIADGARRAGRNIDDLQLWWYARTSIAESEEAALEDSLASLAAAGAFAARANPALSGVPDSLRGGMAQLGEHYDMASHLRTDPDNPNRRLITDPRLRDYLLDRVAIVGSPEGWVDRISQLRARGVGNVLCIGASGDKDLLIDLVGSRVIPALGGRASGIDFARDRPGGSFGGGSR